MDGFCGAVEGFLKDHNNVMQMPDSTGTDDGQSFDTLLDDYAGILTKAIDRLAALPPIADPVGQTAKQTFVGNYTSARDMVTSAKAQLDAAYPVDFDVLTQASDTLGAAQQTALTALSAEMAVVNSPELRTAVSSADRCMSVS